MANISFLLADAVTFSPELVLEEETHEAEEAGSFSPELFDGDENEAIDPEEDRAILVIFITNLYAC